MKQRFAVYKKPTFNENSIFQVIERKENSPYEMEPVVKFTFRGRPAETYEKKSYRAQQAVDVSSEAQYIVASNLPDDVKAGDNVLYLGQIYKVSSVGFYLQDDNIICPEIMSDEYILANCKKGITIQ